MKNLIKNAVQTARESGLTRDEILEAVRLALLGTNESAVVNGSIFQTEDGYRYKYDVDHNIWDNGDAWYTASDVDLWPMDSFGERLSGEVTCERVK
jgi:hypothetical protein